MSIAYLKITSKQQSERNTLLKAENFLVGADGVPPLQGKYISVYR